MAQIFHPSTNVIARVSLLGAVIAPLALMMIGSAITRSPAQTKVQVALDQPVPFSHQHHVTELGIDCRYCHTSVEKSSFAGIPATHTCMSCHSQIWTNSPLLEPVRESYRSGQPLFWNRVNKLPEFVYFNHSIHINVGINCNVCHGPIQGMQLTWKAQPFHMSWCLECHRNPENAVGPRESVFALYRKNMRKADLTAEERALLAGTPYKRSPEELEKGRQFLDDYHINKAELTDCWICHR